MKSPPGASDASQEGHRHACADTKVDGEDLHWRGNLRDNRPPRRRPSSSGHRRATDDPGCTCRTPGEVVPRGHQSGPGRIGHWPTLRSSRKRYPTPRTVSMRSAASPIFLRRLLTWTSIVRSSTMASSPIAASISSWRVKARPACRRRASRRRNSVGVRINSSSARSAR